LGLTRLLSPEERRSEVWSDRILVTVDSEHKGQHASHDGVTTNRQSPSGRTLCSITVVSIPTPDII
jgi:hypothetical protein